MKFQKTALMLALSTIAGSSFADLNYNSNYDPQTGAYSQANGVSSTVTGAQLSSTKSQTDQSYDGQIVHQTAPVQVGKISDGVQDYQTYTYQETRKGQVTDSTQLTNTTITAGQLSHSESISSVNTATGTVLRTANTKVTLDTNGQEIAGTKQRDSDSSFAFRADDLTKVEGATYSSNYTRHVQTQYTDTDPRDTVTVNQSKLTDLSNTRKYDAQGKEVVDTQGNPVYLVQGNLNNEQSSQDVTYHTDVNAQGKTVSRQGQGVVRETQQVNKNDNITVNYAQDAQGHVQSMYVNPDYPYSVTESKVSHQVAETTSKTTAYDTVSAIATTQVDTAVNQETQTSLDGFVAENQNQSNSTVTEYRDGMHLLGQVKSSKQQKHEVSRTFNTDAQNKIILNQHNQPSSITKNIRDEQIEAYESHYQPTHYTTGVKKGQDYQLTDHGEDSRYRNTDLQKSQLKSEIRSTATHPDGFVTYQQQKVDNSIQYDRSLQENIEVNRQISQKSSENSKNFDQRTVNVNAGTTQDLTLGSIGLKAGNTYATGITGIQIYQDNNNNITLNEEGTFTADDVKTWVDETGKKRHYVVVGQDLNGQDIRSEVTLTGKNSASSMSVETLKTTSSDKNYQEAVKQGQTVAYEFDAKEKTSSHETSKDGSLLYEDNQSTKNENIKVYSTGKNALSREKTQSYQNKRTGSDVEADAQGNLAIVSTFKINEQGQAKIQQYQQGQEKQSHYQSQSSSDVTRYNEKNEQIATEHKKNSAETTHYAQGKHALDQQIKTSSDVNRQYENSVIVANQFYGVDENGVALKLSGGKMAETVDGKIVSSPQNVVWVQQDATVSTQEQQKIDEKVYQSGAVVYQKSEQAQNQSTQALKDGLVQKQGTKSTDDVTLYAHGQSDKYREAVKTTAETGSGNRYELNAKGEAVVTGRYDYNNHEKNTAVNYQEGKNALTQSQTRVSTHTEKLITATSTEQRKGIEKAEALVYQADQKIATDKNLVSNLETAVVNQDQSAYTHTQATKARDVVYNTDMGLLASQEIKEQNTSEYTEALKQKAADGKTTNVSVTRGHDDVIRTDFSQTQKAYGSETNTATDGSKTVVAKTQTAVIDQFNTSESTTLNRTESTVASNKTATTKSETRVDNVQGTTLTAEKTQTDAAGKTTTVVGSTSIKAGEVKVGNVRISAEQGLNAGNKVIGGVANGVANNDAVNMGQMRSYAADLNRRVNDVEEKAYAGVAIALAAQQPVPNIHPGQFAMFGGVGHYEGESAGALGIMSVLEDGRTSLSGALGVAGSGEVGGRVGVSYVFGGK